MAASHDSTSPLPSTMPAQPGLEWSYEDDLFHPEPTWTIEPDISIIRKIALRELSISHNAQCDISFLAEGSFNKVYKISSSDSKAYVMRVTLPVYPRLKTTCEVATMEFAAQHTDIPLAKVIAHDASYENELGFEWMIQKYIPGQSLEDAWITMSMSKKEELVRKIVAYLARLFSQRFTKIGGLYKTATSPASSAPQEWTPTMLPLLSVPPKTSAFELGEIVSLQLFIGTHLSSPIPRGPYPSSRAWLSARLQLYIESASKVLVDTSLAADDYDRTAASSVMNMGMRLLILLPQIFPTEDEEEKECIVHHHDLDIQNILVDEEGEVTGVIDWENIHTAPLWHACQLPKFLCGRTSHIAPIKSDFMMRDHETGELMLDDIYELRLRQHEQTQLRKVFFAEMDKVCPEWTRVFERSRTMQDFELAVSNIDNDLCCGKILQWIQEAMGNGEPTSLRDVLRR